MKKICVISLFLSLVFFGCDKGAVSPTTPEILPKADVRIAISGEALIDDVFGFDIAITEHNGVKVNITSIEVQLLHEGVIVYQKTDTTARVLSANGTIDLVFIVVLEEGDVLDKVRIIVKGVDANGHQISVSKDFT